MRGNTQRALIRMLREAGAVEVHVRIASPPVKWPCFYGIDFASRAELIANGLDVDGVRASINADSLGYVSEQGLIAATEQPANRLCTACFTGEYPIPLGESELLGKHVLEGIERRAAVTGWTGRAGRQRDGARRRRGRAHPAVTDAEQFTYAASGVDIDAGERAVTLMKAAVEKTNRPEVVGGLGGFAGLFALDTAKYRRPLLASSTDGVGTKIALARQLDRHDTVGIDLVAMVVDDLVACGAEPLFLQDYVACGKVVPERIAAIVTGIAAGCTQAGAALVGGETAEHGDLMDADEYDLAATAVGRGRGRRRPGARAGAGRRRRRRHGVVRVPLQRLLAGAPGGAPRAGLDLSATPAGLDRPLGEELLEPTRIYARDCLALVDALGVERRARLRAHHRRRAGRQHRPRRPRRAWSAVLDREHLGAAAGRAAAGGARRAARGVRAGVQLRRRHGRRGRRGRRRRARWRSSATAGVPGLGRRQHPGARRTTTAGARLVGTYR